MSRSDFQKNQLILLVLLVSVALLFASLMATVSEQKQNARLSEQYQQRKLVAEQNAMLRTVHEHPEP